jgi:hypothetical protein
MVSVRPEASPDALDEATYPSESAMPRMRSLVGSETFGSPRSALDTVAMETPDARATSSILVTAFITPSSVSLVL